MVAPPGTPDPPIVALDAVSNETEPVEIWGRTGGVVNDWIPPTAVP